MVGLMSWSALKGWCSQTKDIAITLIAYSAKIEPQVRNFLCDYNIKKQESSSVSLFQFYALAAELFFKKVRKTFVGQIKNKKNKNEH
jgi:hypothetical protein